MYDRLAGSARLGLDRAAVAETATKYEMYDDGRPPLPLPYNLPDAVRLLCVGLHGLEGGDDLRDAAAAACDAFVKALPPGYRVHRNPPASYHVSVFHTGQPSEFRPKSADAVAEEVAVATALVAATAPVKVVVDRLVLAASGVLLLLLTAPGGGPSPVDDLRRRCRAAWPDAPAKQTTYVMHVSLCRILEIPPATQGKALLLEEWALVMEGVEKLSENLRDMRATLRTVWHVCERMQMTCGDKDMDCIVTNLPLGSDLG